MQNYSYLRPSNRAINSRYSPQQIEHNSHKRGHNKEHYQNQDFDALQRMKSYLNNKGLNRQINDNLLMRYLSLNPTGGIIEAVNKFKYYEEWWSMAAINSALEREILNTGVFYCYGRDIDYCPNLYFKPSLIQLNTYTIEQYLVSIRTLLVPVEEYMLVEGKIDKWNLIVDLTSFNETKAKNNYSVFLNNFKKVCYSYPCRLKYLLVMLPSSSGIWSLVPSLSGGDSIVKQMVNDLGLHEYFVRIEGAQELLRYIQVDERERKYGGTHENLSEYWPILSTNKLMQVNSMFVGGSQESETYKSILNNENEDFFGEKEETTTKCKCSIQ